MNWFSEEMGALGTPDGIAGKGDRKLSLLQECANYTPIVAFGEFIDNTLGNYKSTYLSDNWEGTVPALEIEIELNLDGKPEELSIVYSENSGGVHRDNLGEFVSKGWSSWKEKLDYPVGAWGLGQLVGFAYFGRYNIIRTHHLESTDGGRILQFGCKDPIDPEADPQSNDPCQYYHEENTHWNVGVSIDNQLPNAPEPGKTRFRLMKLEPAVAKIMKQSSFKKELFKQLRKYYTNQITEIEAQANHKNGTTGESMVSITISGKHNVKIFGVGTNTADPGSDDEIIERWQSGDFEEIAKHMIQLPRLRPRWMKFEVPFSHLEGMGTKEGKIGFEILVGMMKSRDKIDKAYRGFMIWGNGRMFAEGYVPNMKGTTPVESIKQDELKGTNIRYHRWKGFVKIHCTEPTLIPWNKPSKWGYPDFWDWRPTFDRILALALEPFYVT